MNAYIRMKERYQSGTGRRAPRACYLHSPHTRSRASDCCPGAMPHLLLSYRLTPKLKRLAGNIQERPAERVPVYRAESIRALWFIFTIQQVGTSRVYHRPGEFHRITTLRCGM